MRPRASTPWHINRRHIHASPTYHQNISKTLLLPRTPFPLWSDNAKVESAFRDKTCDELYRWQWKNATGPLFVLHDGPPYANGDLHMGHALNKILKDFINRFQVLRGRRVHYLPGWDCHGLPIENRALQELGKDSWHLPAHSIRSAAHATATREITSQREQFRQLGIMADWSAATTYRTFDHSYEMRQLRIFQNMVAKGLIYRRYRPVYYSPSSRSALAEAELTYRDNHLSHAVYVSFEIDFQAEGLKERLRHLLSGNSKAHLLVWTTTPWTLTANMGIAIHPEQTYVMLKREMDHNSGPVIVMKERLHALCDVIGPFREIAEVLGSELVGTSYKPLFGRLRNNPSLKVIPASFVTADSGTGLVHCAPAHGVEDYNAFQALGLLENSDMLCHLDAAGRFTDAVADVIGSAAAQKLIGQEVIKSGSKAIVRILESDGSLVKCETVRHRYPYDWRTDKPVVTTAMSQWFSNLDAIKVDALCALQGVSFVPPASRKRLDSFIRSRSEWCISRQRVWGVPIPSLHHVATDQALLDHSSLEHILSILDKKGIEYWWSGPVEEFLPPSLHHNETFDSAMWRKGTDTMDVWFDSGTSWSILSELTDLDSSGSSANTSENEFQVADVCLEGSDQHRGWFQSQLLTAVASTTGDGRYRSPYKNLITHGMVLDQEGRKMSKSLGNVTSPIVMVNGGKGAKKEPTCSADALRLWAASIEYWRDTSMGPTVLAQAAESLRKIRNSARFILGIIDPKAVGSGSAGLSEEVMGLAERYVMQELYKLEQTALEGYASFNFPKVTTALTHFTNVTLSSLYFDITKDCLYADAKSSPQREAVVAVLTQLLSTMTSVLAPVLPYLAEEIHHTLSGIDDMHAGSSVFWKTWEPLDSKWNDPQAESDMNDLLRVRRGVLSLLERARGQKRIKSSLEAEFDIILSDEMPRDTLYKLLHREENFLKTLFIVSDVHLVGEGSHGVPSQDWTLSDSVSIPGWEVDLVLQVHPARQKKCPRCWTYSRPQHDSLCSRCTKVLHQ